MGTGNPLILPTGDVVEGPEPVSHRRSVSQLENFLRCPEGYRLEKIAKAPRAQAAWFAQGTAVHDAIEKWEATGRVFGVAEITAWYKAAWETEIGLALDAEPDLSKWLTGGRTRADVDIANREVRGLDQALAYQAWALSQAHIWRVMEYLPDEYAVEVPFDITLNGVRLIGYIDQIIEFEDGQIIPRDLKTGSKLPSSPRQLGVYSIAIEETLGIPRPLYGDFYMAKNTDVTKPYDLSRYTRERVGKWFEDLDSMISEGRFIPNPGDICRVCGVARFCDLLGPEAHLFPVEFSTTKEGKVIE